MKRSKTKTATLPKLLVRITYPDGSTEIVERDDPREEWCASYNEQAEGRGRIAEPVTEDERRFRVFCTNWTAPADDDPQSLVAFPELQDSDAHVYEGGKHGQMTDRAAAFAKAARLNKATVAEYRRKARPLSDGCGAPWWIVAELGAPVTGETFHVELGEDGRGIDHGGARATRAVVPTEAELSKYPVAAAAECVV